MTVILADEAPWWEPGTAHGYHVNTFGFLVGELVRRASGRSLGTVVANEIAGPLGADFFIGVPTGDLGRVAEFVGMAESPGPWSSEGKDDGEVMVHHAVLQPAHPVGHGGDQLDGVAHGRTAFDQRARERPGYRPSL